MSKVINLEDYRNKKDLILASRQNMKSGLSNDELVDIFKDLFPNGMFFENLNGELEVEEYESVYTQEEIDLIEQAIDYYKSFNKELTDKDFEIIESVKYKHDIIYGDIYDTSKWGMR